VILFQGGVAAVSAPLVSLVHGDRFFFLPSYSEVSPRLSSTYSSRPCAFPDHRPKFKGPNSSPVGMDQSQHVCSVFILYVNFIHYFRFYLFKLFRPFPPSSTRVVDSFFLVPAFTQQGLFLALRPYFCCVPAFITLFFSYPLYRNVLA